MIKSNNYKPVVTIYNFVFNYVMPKNRERWNKDFL